MPQLKRWFLLAIMLLTGLMLGWVVLSFVITRQSLTALQQGQFQTAIHLSQVGLALSQPVSQVCLNRSHLLQAEVAGLKVIKQLSQIGLELATQSSLTTLDLTETIPSIPNLINDLDTLATNITKLSWLQSYLPSSGQKLLWFVQANSDLLQQLAHDIGQTKRTWLVVFQNSNELRATGGFMGSYALLTVDRGKLTEVKIEDIYDADGQFRGFVTPPAGVDRYLSADHGLRLPDANWSPDLPKSAQQVLSYFALGKRPDISGVIFIDNNLVKNLLELTGPVFVKDYQKLITADNFDQALQDRGEFFPGDKRKKHLLSLVFNQLTLKLPSTLKQQPNKVGSLLVQAVQEKQLQAFALDQNWQELFSRLNLTNPLQDHSNCLDLALIESNVGINKVNAEVGREVKLSLSDDAKPRLKIWITFNNRAETGTSEYVNYQRVMIEPQWQLTQLQIDSTVVKEVDDQLITTSTGDTFRQVGFLVTVKPQTKTVVEIELEDVSLKTQAKLCLFKQPGLPATAYAINTTVNNKTKMVVTTLTEDKKVLLTD